MSAALAGSAPPATQSPSAFRDRLTTLPFKIAYETYVDNNWEIFVMNPDGSGQVNLTNTPKFGTPTTSASSGTFMQITSTLSNNSTAVSLERQFRFGLRLQF